MNYESIVDTVDMRAKSKLVDFLVVYSKMFSIKNRFKQFFERCKCLNPLTLFSDHCAEEA